MKKINKLMINIFLICIFITQSSQLAFAIDTSNTVPDIHNEHLISKVKAFNGEDETNMWITNYDIPENDNYNCYSYALGHTNSSIQPGDSCFLHKLYNKLRKGYVDVNELADIILTDLQNFGVNGRIIDNGNYNVKLKSNEYLIALRVTSESFYEVGNVNTYDYHFMRRINSGIWRFKAGNSGKVVQLSDGYNPDNVTWDVIKNCDPTDEYNYIQDKVNYYTSDIVYIALSESNEDNINNYEFEYIYPKSFSVNEENITLGIGASYYIKPIFDPVEVSNADIIWSRTKATESIASISDINILTTKSAGTYDLIGYSNNFKFSVKIPITVVDAKLGDVNGDDSISVNDSTLVQKYLIDNEVFLNEQIFTADVNSDGKVNIVDVTNIQKRVAGFFEYFPTKQK